MLRDMTGSRRIDREASKSALHALIISKHFWPQLREDDKNVVLPMQIATLMNEYSERFGQIRASRVLHWWKWLGNVDMDIELDSGEVYPVTCKVVEAVVLHKFAEKGIFFLIRKDDRY